MSLTSLLKARPSLSRQLASLVDSSTLESFPRDLPLIAPPVTNHFPLVGTAYDYLFRFEVQRRFPTAVSRRWVADESAQRLEELGEVMARPAREVVKDARAALQQFSLQSSPSASSYETVASHAIRLAKLDAFYRALYVDREMQQVDPGDVRDLLALLRATPFDGGLAELLADPILMNPIFGALSNVLEGADADLISGDALIDLKTTKNPDVRPWLSQLVGYGILATLHRQLEDQSFPHVRRAGFLLPRQGALWVFSFEAIQESPDYQSASDALVREAEAACGVTLEDILTSRAEDGLRIAARPTDSDGSGERPLRSRLLKPSQGPSTRTREVPRRRRASRSTRR